MKLSFKHNNYNVYITAYLINGGGDYDDISNSKQLQLKYTTTLSPQNISNIEFWSDIINPIMYGTLIYEDDQLETMLNANGNLNLHLNLNIRFTSEDVKENVAPKEDFQFSHTFYINSLEIIEKKDEIVKYKIGLISHLFFKFMETKMVSTFSKTTMDGVSCLNVISHLFANSIDLNIPTDKTTMSTVSYISGADMSILQSTMKLLALNMKKPNSDLMLLPYDHMNNVTDVWLKSDFIKNKDVYDSTMKLYKNSIKISIESVQGYDIFGNEVGNLNTKDLSSNIDMIKSVADVTEHTFDYTTRQFSTTPYTKKELQSYFGTQKNNPQFKNRIDIDLKWFKPTQNLKIEGFGREGDDFFNRATSILTKNGVLVINTTGNIYRKPGIDMYVNTDTSKSDSSSVIDFNGRWLATKVKHIFDFKNESYTNTMMLSRLEIPNDSNNFRSIV